MFQLRITACSEHMFQLRITACSEYMFQLRITACSEHMFQRIRMFQRITACSEHMFQLRITACSEHMFQLRITACSEHMFQLRITACSEHMFQLAVKHSSEDIGLSITGINGQSVKSTLSTKLLLKIRFSKWSLKDPSLGHCGGSLPISPFQSIACHMIVGSFWSSNLCHLVNSMF